MAKGIIERKWDSLSKLKDYFEKTNEEKVTAFDGLSLTTKKYVYTLALGELSRRKNDQ